MDPMPAPAVLNAYFHEARSRILDIAAILDRLSRGAGSESITNDPRMANIRKALEAVLRFPEGRAEEVQNIFSLAYDPNWTPPRPRTVI